MSVRSGQTVTVDFTTTSPTTGAAANADSTPAGTLVVNGTDDAAAVTVTNKSTGVYKAAVTLPTLAIGDRVQVRIAATVGGVAAKEYVWEDAKDVLLDASGKTTDAVQTGDNFARIGAAGAGLTAVVAASVTGNVGGSVVGNVDGNVGGNVDGEVSGGISGDLNGNVLGDVAGKVLGGGAGTITGTGARVVDGSGAALATAATQTTITGRLPAALVGGRMDASVGSLAAGVVTDAAFTAPAEAAGRPTGVLAKMRRAWEWLTNKSTRDRSTGLHKLYGADGTTVLETRTQSTTGTVDQETQGA
jgi:hypothetical protein